MKCQEILKVFSSADQRNVFELPLYCTIMVNKPSKRSVNDGTGLFGGGGGGSGGGGGGDGDENWGPSGQTMCMGRTFEYVEHSSIRQDYQELKVQELINVSRQRGGMPATLVTSGLERGQGLSTHPPTTGVSNTTSPGEGDVENDENTVGVGRMPRSISVLASCDLVDCCQVLVQAHCSRTPSFRPDSNLL